MDTCTRGLKRGASNSAETIPTNQPTNQPNAVCKMIIVLICFLLTIQDKSGCSSGRANNLNKQNNTCTICSCIHDP